MMRLLATSTAVALAAASLGLSSCSLAVGSLGPYDSADAASAPFCASLSPAPQLCADFDEGKPTNAGWSSVFSTGGGTLALQPGIDVSPPASLAAKTPSFTVPTQNEPTAGLSYDFVGQARTVHLQSQIRVAAIGPDQCFVALAIAQQQAGGGPYLQAQLFVCAGHAFAQEQNNTCGCQPNDNGFAGTFAPGSWHRFAIEVALGSTPSMTVWVDDPSTPVLAAVPLAYGWQAAPFSVNVGIGYIGGGKGEGIEAGFDDVEAYVR